MTNKILKTSEAQQKPEICCSPSTATNCLHQISGANTLMLTTPPCGSVKAAKCVAAKRTEEKRGRGRAWVYIEMLCAVLAVTGVNQDLCDGRSKKERLAHMNTAYKFQVETMVATKKWVDQFGVAEDKITPEQSLDERVQDIKSNTDRSPISTVTERIIRISKTVMLPQLRKLLDANGHIHSGQQKEDVNEALRLFYWRRPPMLFSTMPSFRRPRTASTLLRCMCSSIKGPR